MGEVVRVRCEVKQLAAMAQELEPSVKRISQTTQEEFANLHSLIHQIQNISASDQA